MPAAGDIKLPAVPRAGEDLATEHSRAQRPTLMRAESINGVVDAIDVCQRHHPVTRYPFNTATWGAVAFSSYVEPFRHHANSASTGILANLRFNRLHTATSLIDSVGGDYAFHAPASPEGKRSGNRSLLVGARWRCWLREAPPATMDPPILARLPPNGTLKKSRIPLRQRRESFSLRGALLGIKNALNPDVEAEQPRPTCR